MPPQTDPPHPPEPPRPDSRGSGDAWALAAGGTQLAASVLAGVYAGYKIDRWRGWGPWGLVTGAALGLALGLYAFLKPLLAKDPK